MLYSDPVGEDMLPMEMGIDLEGDEPGEVWKCMFGLCGESRPRKFRNCGDGFVICFFSKAKRCCSRAQLGVKTRRCEVGAR